MRELEVRTRPHIDIPLAAIALGLTLLLAFTVRGSLAPTAVPTASPLASPLPAQVAPTQIAPVAPPPKEKPKGH